MKEINVNIIKEKYLYQYFVVNVEKEDIHGQVVIQLHIVMIEKKVITHIHHIMIIIINQIINQIINHIIRKVEENHKIINIKNNIMEINLYIFDINMIHQIFHLT